LYATQVGIDSRVALSHDADSDNADSYSSHDVPPFESGLYPRLSMRM
jgi:hypothetical protein